VKRTQPYSTIPIPATIDPAGRRCFVINVPDDPTHIAAFQGMLGKLATWQAWQADDAHSGKDLAAVWRTVLDNLESCVVINIRLKPTDFCMLQLTTDGGVTWSDVADLSDCAHAVAIDEIDQARQRGEIAGGGQQPGDGTGTPLQCYDYDVQIFGNNRWHAPIQIEGGDIITVNNVEGAWWHGDVTHLDWNCPDGTYFGLGNCFGTGYTDAGDPLPAELKMRLIGNIPAGS